MYLHYDGIQKEGVPFRRVLKIYIPDAYKEPSDTFADILVVKVSKYNRAYRIILKNITVNDFYFGLFQLPFQRNTINKTKNTLYSL